VTLQGFSRVESPIGGDAGGISHPRGRSLARLRLPYHLVEPLVIAIDMVIAITTCMIAGLGYNWIFLGHLPAIQPQVAIGLLASINVSAVLAARGDYRVINLTSFYRQAREVVIVWSGVCLVLIGVAFLLKMAEEFSRGAAASFFVLGLVSMLVWRRVLAQFIGSAFAAGAFAPRNVIVIGEPDRLMGSRAMVEIGRCGYTPLRTFQIAPDEFEPAISEGSHALIKDAIETTRQASVAEILLLIGWEHSKTIENITKMLSVLPIPIYLLPDTNVARYLDHRAITVGTTLAAEIQRAPLTRTEQLLKRSFDLIGAIVVLLVLSPLMLITALLVKLDSPGPALFFQTRNGFNGHKFRIVKFRTMHVLEDGAHIRQATRADPRVTPLGRWLRRANIDELPQMLNVLVGDMSLVGPRPHAVAHNTEFEKVVANYAFRQHVKPGITGWAQVNGYRGETATPESIAKRVEFDLWYIKNWNIWLDIRILFRTLMLGLQPTAY
jgi:Undecaprenyl-phosphate glucose phosphotransferase